jgi:hypothetical protein
MCYMPYLGSDVSLPTSEFPAESPGFYLSESRLARWLRKKQNVPYFTPDCQKSVRCQRIISTGLPIRSRN